MIETSGKPATGPVAIASGVLIFLLSHAEDALGLADLAGVPAALRAGLTGMLAAAVAVAAVSRVWPRRADH